MKSLLTILLLTLNCSTAFGQGTFANTIFFDDSIGSPNADVSAIAWIRGHWRGEALGGITEEVWTPALGGSMMCAFKLVVDEKVKFYELVTITEESSSLIMRIKHFNPDLKGWEPQNEAQVFRLVKVADNKVYFDGFTFEKVGKNEINIYVVIQNGSEKEEVKFTYKRARE